MLFDAVYQVSCPFVCLFVWVCFFLFIFCLFGFCWVVAVVVSWFCFLFWFCGGVLSFFVMCYDKVHVSW